MFLLAGCNNTWENLYMQPNAVRGYIKEGLKMQKLYPRKYPVPQVKITDENSFVNAAETILFDEYGESHIKDERPYTVGHADGYWVMSGHLWSENGGVFYIMISEKTGEVIYLTHGK